MASLHDQILKLSGWTAEEINLLAHDRTCPDHWYEDPLPTFALMEIIRDAVDESDTLFYSTDFYNIIKAMGLKKPKMKECDLISKIKRKVKTAEKKSNLMILCEEMTDLSWNHQEVVGPICDTNGITPTWLTEGTALPSNSMVTNGIIGELFQYRKRKDIGWSTIAYEWWKKLFPECDVIPNSQTIRSNWAVVDNNRQLLIRDSSVEAKEKFLCEEYKLPTTKPRKPKESEPLDEPQQNPDDVSTCSSDDGYDTASECSLSPYMLRRHGDAIAILHEMLEQERQEKANLEEQVLDAQEKCRMAETCALDAETERDGGRAALKKMEKEKNKQACKYERELKKATELSEKLHQEMRSLQKSNVARRLATRESQLESEKEKVAKLEDEVEQLNNVVTELRPTKKNRTEQVRYNITKRSEMEERFDKENSTLKERLKELEIKNHELRYKLDEIMGEKEIRTYEDGAYTSDIRVVCHLIISQIFKIRTV